MKVTLAIPNYNGLENLKILLPRIAKEGFDEIIVIDDKSTDESISFLKSISDIYVIQGDKNIGPAGNRNRVLGKATGDLVVFLDADMELITKDVVQKLNELFSDSSKALVGGLILTLKNEPMWWNYGYELNPVRDAKAAVAHELAFKFWENSEVMEYIKNTYKEITRNFEITFEKPAEMEVDWVSEANLCIRRKVFEEVGGFDNKMRYHADQDLCKRVRDRGYKVYFSSLITTKHMEIDTFGTNRTKFYLESLYYYYKKHWGMSKRIFDKLYFSPKQE
ncbi:MAG: glycosyltransferase [Patescibacteria group bacterium]